MWEAHAIKITYDSHVFKWHMSLLYVGCMKFPTNRFVGNLCPLINTLSRDNKN
jgi:hypothetical protein